MKFERAKKEFKLRMLETTNVSLTGLDTELWEKGETYTAPGALAKSLVTAKLAEVVKEPETAPNKEAKTE